MFNPKITLGHWRWVKYGINYEILGNNHEEVTLISPVIPTYENHFAVLAVPELLDVYKKAKAVVDSHSSSKMRVDMSELKSAINKLERIHCK